MTKQKFSERVFDDINWDDLYVNTDEETGRRRGGFTGRTLKKRFAIPDLLKLCVTAEATIMTLA